MIPDCTVLIRQQGVMDTHTGRQTDRRLCRS